MKIKSHALLAYMLFLASSLLAQQGQLDLSFGENGIVKQSYAPPFPSNNEPQSLAYLNDGKFMVAGQHNSAIVFSRFEADGNLDLSFGDSGEVLIDMAWLTNDNVTGLIVQPDGKTLALVQSVRYNPEIEEDWRNIYVMRFTPDWEFDDTFGQASFYAPMGVAEVETGYDVTTVSSFQFLEDGKIVLSGMVRNSFSHNTQVFVARLNSDGTMDASFDSNGIAFPSWSDISEGAGQVALQQDGKLILSGSAWENDTLVYLIARLNKDGSIDSSFGMNGKVTGTLPSANYYVQRLFVQENGNLLAWVNGDLFPPLSLDVLRLHPNGDFDASFGSNGVMHIQNEKIHLISRILMDDEGSFFLAGNWRDSMHHNRYDFALAKLSPDFNWVEDFGNAGVAIVRDTANDDFLRTAAILPDGKVLLAGTASPIYYIFNRKLVKFYGRDTMGVLPPEDSLLLNDDGLTIFPNPVDDHFNICYPLEEFSFVTVDLFNSVGELLHTFIKEAGRKEGLHCENFAWPKDIVDKGVYLIKIYGRKFAYSGKILKP